MILLIIIFITGLIFIFCGGLYNRYGADAIKNVSNQYNIQLEKISEEQIEYGRLYKVKSISSPSIEFFIIRTNGNNYDDYYQRIQKYYFDQWKSSYKVDFAISEKYDDSNMLNYSNYIEIKNYDDIIIEVPKTYEFREFVKKHNIDVARLELYLKKDKDIINIYMENSITLEDAIKTAQNEYNSMFSK